jgi:hypothetical protein
MSEKHGLHLVVHFPAAAEPFKDEHAEPSETIGHLKTRVLTAFGLVDGALPDGSTATYTLYHEKKPLENAMQTLGDVAGEHKTLQLKLAQQITQGR